MSTPNLVQVIQAAKAAHQAMPTEQLGIFGTSVTVTQILLFTLNLLFGGIGVAFVKVYPEIRKAANARAGSLDEQRRIDMDKMAERLEKIEAKADAADRRAQAAENKLVSAVSAISLLSAEVRRLSPGGNDVLNMVNELIQTATSGDFGVGRGIETLSRKHK